MSEVLEPNTLERWQREPISFIEQILRNPQTNKPFELFPAQRQWFKHCWQLRDDGRLEYGEQLIGWPKRPAKAAPLQCRR